MSKSKFNRLTAAATSMAMAAIVIQYFPQKQRTYAEDLTGETSDGFKYEIDAETGDATLVEWTGDKETVKKLVLPDTVDGHTVTKLNAGVVSGCPVLTSVTLPDDLKLIGRKAFEGSPKLKEITLPNTLQV